MVDLPDPIPAFRCGGRAGECTYEELLAEGDPLDRWLLPDDEWETQESDSSR